MTESFFFSTQTHSINLKFHNFKKGECIDLPKTYAQKSFPLPCEMKCLLAIVQSGGGEWPQYSTGNRGLPDVEQIASCWEADIKKAVPDILGQVLVTGWWLVVKRK